MESKKRDSQRITLVVDGHKLALDVAPHEEVLYRRAADSFNKRVNQYRARYTGDEDYPRLMAAIELALLLESCREQLDERPVEQQLERLTSEVTDFLKEIGA